MVNPNVTSLLTLIIIALPIFISSNRHEQRGGLKKTLRPEKRSSKGRIHGRGPYLRPRTVPKCFLFLLPATIFIRINKTIIKSLKPSTIAAPYQTGQNSKVNVAVLICIFSLVTNNFDLFYTKKRHTPETRKQVVICLFPASDSYSTSEKTTLNFADNVEVFQMEYFLYAILRSAHVCRVVQPTLTIYN